MKLSVLLAFVVVCWSDLLNAQLCTGSLGDPIINVDFGAGHTPPLSNSATTFEYTNDCPPKGKYTLSNFIFGCGDHSWVAMTGDHTGNLNGNYMLVNAAGTPGNVHVDTATGLCGNTTYQYAAWITNVMQSFSCGGHPVLSNLTFNVESYSGQLLASYNTGNIPLTDSKMWNHFGFCFKTPADINAVILRIITTPDSRDICGSGFAIDDITLNECGPAVEATIDGATGPAEVCADYTNPFILNATYSAGFSDPVLQWQSSTDTGKIWISIPGAVATTYSIPRRLFGPVSYRVLISERANTGSPNCSISSNAIFTYVHELAVHAAPQIFNGCTNKNLLLPASDPKALKVLWIGPNGYSSDNPAAILSNVQYADTGLYKLKETFYFGCVSLDTFYLRVYPGTTVTTLPSHPVCEGMSQTLSAISADDVSYKWTPSTGLSNDAIPNPVASPVDSTKYKVVTTNSFGCKDSAYLIINVYRNPGSNAGPDKIIVIGDSAILNASIKGTAINYYWSPAAYMNDDHSPKPVVFPLQDEVYTLNVISTVGCGTVTDDVKVKVYRDIFIPNAFTPNGDGKNDLFRVTAFDNYKIGKLLIYNRWGELIYRANNSYEGWDGNFNGAPQPAGTYVYYLEIQHPYKKTIVKQGTITLIR